MAPVRETAGATFPEMRYDYQCGTCGQVTERVCSMKEHAEVPDWKCPCGAEAFQLFNGNVEIIARGHQKSFDVDNLRNRPIGWERGNTAAAQVRRYDRIRNEAQKLAQANDKQAIKGGIRLIAKVPREKQRARQNQFGKDYWDPSRQSASELKQKLKDDGEYLHKD